MKAVYIMLSGLLLSIMATLAMAGLISVSKLVKPKTNHSIVMVTKDGNISPQLLPDDHYNKAGEPKKYKKD